MDPYAICWWCDHLFSSHDQPEAKCREKDCACETFMEKPKVRPGAGMSPVGGAVRTEYELYLRRERIAAAIMAGIAASPHEPRWTLAAEKLPNKMKELEHRAAMQAIVYT